MSAVLDLLTTLVRGRSVAEGEGELARRCARVLEDAGLKPTLLPWRGVDGRLASGREQLVARSGDEATPLTLTGHLDTVPADATSWTFDPWSAELDGDRVLGRGTSDMKSGVAALVTAVAAHARRPHVCHGVQVVLTAGEETGCTGAARLPDRELVGGGPLLVAEPTANRLVPGHKGALWLRLTATGRAAHGSAPELGDNAVVRLSRAAVALHEHADWPHHDRFGPVTANVGLLTGGTAINVVPDRAELLLDLRTVPGVEAGDVQAEVARLAGDGVRVEQVLALRPVDTASDEPFVGLVRDALAATGPDQTPSPPARFFTDASALHPLLDAPPTVILGPGEPDQCHVVDEWCSAQRVEQAVEVYSALLDRWCHPS